MNTDGRWQMAERVFIAESTASRENAIICLLEHVGGLGRAASSLRCGGKRGKGHLVGVVLQIAVGGEHGLRYPREFCHFDDTTCLSLLKRLIKVQGEGLRRFTGPPGKRQTSTAGSPRLASLLSLPSLVPPLTKTHADWRRRVGARANMMALTTSNGWHASRLDRAVRTVRKLKPRSRT